MTQHLLWSEPDELEFAGQTRKHSWCLALSFKMLRLSVDLPHVKQEADWDCGLACCSMVLQQLLGNKYEEGTFQDVCRKQGFGTSVWTVDIASILTAYNVNYMFFTKTLGADSSFRENSFYQETFEDDESRVNRLFEMAPELNIKVEKRWVQNQYYRYSHFTTIVISKTVFWVMYFSSFALGDVCRVGQQATKIEFGSQKLPEFARKQFNTGPQRFSNPRPTKIEPQLAVRNDERKRV